MPHGVAVLSVAGVVLLTAQTAHAPASATLSQLGAHFVCPEVLPNDDERQRAWQDFQGAYQQAYPDAPVSGATAYRHVLLETHGCEELPPPRVRIYPFTGRADQH
jgi:hypothetical protein